MARQSKAGFAALVVMMVAFVLLNLVSILFGVQLLGPVAGDDGLLLWLCRGSTIVVAVLAFVITWNIYKARAYSSYSFCPRFRLPITYYLDERGFQFDTGSNTGLIKWSEISNCFDFATALCFVSGDLIFPMPKRGFNSALQVKALRNFVRARGVSVTSYGREPDSLTYVGNYEPSGKIIYDDKGLPVRYAVVTGSGVISLPLTNLSQLQKLEVELQKIVDGEATSLDSSQLKAVDDLVLSPGHPQSSLISEPLSYLQSAVSVSVECNYKFGELRKIDRMLFFKFTFTRLCRDYIIFILFMGLMTTGVFALTGSLVDPVQFLGRSLEWVLFAVVLLTVNVQGLLRLREAAIKNLIEYDQPVIVQLSETLCTVRTRRSVMHYPLHDFTSCFATSEHFICVLPGGSVVIPRRAITNRVDAASVEQLLNRSISHYQELQ